MVKSMNLNSFESGMMILFAGDGRSVMFFFSFFFLLLLKSPAFQVLKVKHLLW